MVINRVGPLSSAKVVGLLYAIIGLVFGAIISLLFLPSRAGESADNRAGIDITTDRHASVTPSGDSAPNR